MSRELSWNELKQLIGVSGSHPDKQQDIQEHPQCDM